MLAGIALSLWRRMTGQGRARGATVRHGFSARSSCSLRFRSPAWRSPSRRSGCAALLQLSRHPARHHRHCRAALSAVRKVLPHLPAAGPTGRETLPGRRPEGRGRASARVAASVSPRACTSTICERILPQVGFDYSMPGPAGHWQAALPGVQTQIAFHRATENEGGTRVAKAPVSEDDSAQPIRAASELHAAGRLAGTNPASRRKSWSRRIAASAGSSAAFSSRCATIA